MSNLARQPLQIVEIDIDYCTRSYGAAPCTASLSSSNPRKCFNTFSTCQDTGHFNKGTLTLRFAKNIAGLPKGQTIFPALQSVSTNPTKITLGAVDDRTGSLGKRARVTVRLQDFTYGDALTDKYAAERLSGGAQHSAVGYDPAEFGTFFGKLRARYPYYFGRALRVKNGYVGDDIATMDTDHYLITEWKGPGASGSVEFTAQDPLKLADKEFALCPKPTTGKIPADVTDVSTPTFDVIPAGIGSDYATSGQITIGTEIAKFTRVGDTFTITERGVGGSIAEAHSAGDTLQQCYVVDDEYPEAVVADLLENFAEIPAAWIDETVWATEVRRWAANLRFNRVVTNPTPVVQLLGQIMDMGFVIWSDSRNQKIKMRANRPVDVDEEAPSITDTSHILSGTINRSDLDEQRLTQVWSVHGMINYAESQSDADNYRVVEVVTDLSAEGDDQYGQKKVHIIYMPWLGVVGSATHAAIIAARMLTRYEATPQEVTFAADIKDKADLGIGNLITVTSRVLQDVTGANSPAGMQVTTVDEVDPGNRLSVTAQSYQFDGRWGWLHDTGYTTDYDAAATSEIADGCFMIDDGVSSTFPDGTSPYIMF